MLRSWLTDTNDSLKADMLYLGIAYSGHSIQYSRLLIEQLLMQ